MKLDYETVHRAIKGDRNAQAKLLNHYASYINAYRLLLRSNRTVQNIVM